MKILVTGANGLLGQKLAALLLKNDTMDIVLTARGKPAMPVGRARYLSLDITDRDAVADAFEDVRPDVVINAAAMTLVDQCETQREACWKANVDAVEYLVNACRHTNSRLIHVSTDFIFDGSHGPLDEEAVPNPVNYYGETKLAGEHVIRQSNIRWCILRTVLVYGVTYDMSRSNIVLWVKESLEQGKMIRVVNDQWRTPTLAEDLAMGCYLAAVKNATGIFHISGRDFLSPYDIALKTADHFQLDRQLIVPTDSTTFKQPAKRPLKTGFIIEKARRELGYEPHSFEDGLAVIARQIHSHVL